MPSKHVKIFTEKLSDNFEVYSLISLLLFQNSSILSMSLTSPAYTNIWAIPKIFAQQSRIFWKFMCICGIAPSYGNTD